MSLKANAEVCLWGWGLIEMLKGRMYYNQKNGTHPNNLQKDIPKWLDVRLHGG